MNRTELAALVSPKALDVEPASATQVMTIADPLRDALTSYFATPEGQADLANAPRVNGKQITAAEAVDALIEESKGL